MTESIKINFTDKLDNNEFYECREKSYRANIKEYSFKNIIGLGKDEEESIRLNELLESF